MTDHYPRIRRRALWKQRAKDCFCALLLLIGFYLVITLVDERDKAVTKAERLEQDNKQKDAELKTLMHRQVACGRSICIQI